MSQQASLDALSGQVSILVSAVQEAAAELSELKSEVDALSASGAIDDTTQLDAISARISDAATSLHDAVASAKGASPQAVS